MVDDPSKTWVALIRHTVRSAKRRSKEVARQMHTLDKQIQIIGSLTLEFVALAEIHKPDSFGHCSEDQQPWPCSTARIIEHGCELITSWEEPHG